MDLFFWNTKIEKLQLFSRVNYDIEKMSCSFYWHHYCWKTYLFQTDFQLLKNKAVPHIMCRSNCSLSIPPSIPGVWGSEGCDVRVQDRENFGEKRAGQCIFMPFWPKNALEMAIFEQCHKWWNRAGHAPKKWYPCPCLPHPIILPHHTIRHGRVFTIVSHLAHLKQNYPKKWNPLPPNIPIGPVGGVPERIEWSINIQIIYKRYVSCIDHISLPIINITNLLIIQYS